MEEDNIPGTPDDKTIDRGHQATRQYVEKEEECCSNISKCNLFITSIDSTVFHIGPIYWKLIHTYVV